VFNKEKYNQMSPRQQKAIDDNCTTEAAGRVGGPWGKFEDAGVDKVKAEAGQEVYKLTPEQTAAWKKAAEPLVKTWADGVKTFGVDPDVAMKELRADLAKYNALAK
jgi:TRAP-type C4-dicarboxylate transport system substrate-binding protein